jgi:5-methylcytosine-specific restriction endonuclease McrA
MEKCTRCKSDKISKVLETEFYDVYKCSECTYMTNIPIKECCRKTKYIITKENRQDNLIKIYHQCVNCGGANRTKPLSQKIYSTKITGEFSDVRFDQWHEDRNCEYEELSIIVKENNYDTSKYKKYNVDYLNSAEWKIKREKVLVRDNYLCQECKNKTAQVVHHKTYENIFNEPLEDLIALCHECHTEIHRVLNVAEMKNIMAQAEEYKKGSR